MNDDIEYFKTKYKLTNLIADPIYGSIKFTCPLSDDNQEITEENLIDNPWLQRLRNIHQLQSTFWVFPSAEHSRFLHSLGTMHLAGIFALNFYQDFRNCFSDCPSICLIEELMRLSGLLHDIGHGPFGHKFDMQYLVQQFNNLNHEKIGKKIIEDELGDKISKIKRSPSGNFEPGEIINPKFISFIINKDAVKEETFPDWLDALRTFFCCSFFTVDNLDYVLRDSYFTGYSKDPINLERILYYTSISKDGILFSSNGKNSFKQFLGVKMDLFNSVYYHRTVRAIDLSIDSIFLDTMMIMCPKNPIENLESYKNLTDQELFSTVKKWKYSSDQSIKILGEKWDKILNREKEWFEAWRKEISITENHDPIYPIIFNPSIKVAIEQQIYKLAIKKVDSKDEQDFFIQIDIPTQDPRPDNPYDFNKKIKIIDSNTGNIEEKEIFAWLEDIPEKIISLRVYTNRAQYRQLVNKITSSFFEARGKTIPGNI